MNSQHCTYLHKIRKSCGCIGLLEMLDSFFQPGRRFIPFQRSAACDSNSSIYVEIRQLTHTLEFFRIFQFLLHPNPENLLRPWTEHSITRPTKRACFSQIGLLMILHGSTEALYFHEPKKARRNNEPEHLRPVLSG